MNEDDFRALVRQTGRAVQYNEGRCLMRGPTVRTETKPCCGTVEVFLCDRDMELRWHTRCRTCDHFVRG